MIPVINSHCRGNFDGRSAYEMSSYGATYNFLQRHFSDAHFSEYFESKPLGSIIDGVRNEDATRLTFANETFDIVTSNQVFEHVVDDLQAFSECHRVLKQNGALIFTVPLYDAPTTVRLAQLTDAGIDWLATPEYHDSRLGGPQSAPVFWRHSLTDIAERVSRAGFRAVTVVPVSVLKRAQIMQPVVYAVK
jgi:SAM-dependent methyltransferase